MWLLKSNTRDPCGDRNVLYLNCIDVNIPEVVLDYSFTIYYHWG